MTVTTASTFVTLGPASNNGIFAPVAPIQSLISSTTVVPTLGTGIGRPRQPMARTSSDIRIDDKDEVSPPGPSLGPDLYDDPVIQPELQLKAPQVVFPTIRPTPGWDDALNSFDDEVAAVWTKDSSLSPAPVIELEAPASTIGSAGAAGVAIAIWSTWEFRSRVPRQTVAGGRSP